MAIQRKEAEHVARLARLDLSEEEVALYTEQLGRILEHVDKLNELDTENVEPLSHASAAGNVFRRWNPGSRRSAPVLEKAPLAPTEPAAGPAVHAPADRRDRSIPALSSGDRWRKERRILPHPASPPPAPIPRSAMSASASSGDGSVVDKKAGR